MFLPDDTIVAIATPPGRGGLGVVRLSGPRAAAMAGGMLDRRRPLAPRRATFCRVVDGSNGAAVIDQVLATYFPRPGSYTGEDVVEISAHGSPVLLRQIVSAAIRAGARLAEPGEFTLRAFLNGRLDLVQAEAVADLIEAVTPLQARVAFDQLEGTVTRRIGDVDRALFDLIARLEASIDFPDEGYHFMEADAVATETRTAARRLGALLEDAHRGRIVREGRQVVILGKPNVGKSTLFNSLLGAPRAIVTDMAGTTRDLLTEKVDIEGIPVTLVDTAGIRKAEDVVEVEGVSRARGAMAVADVSIIVLDRSRPLDEDDRQLMTDTGAASRLIVANKVDLPACWQAGDLCLTNGTKAVEVSLASGIGVADLRTALGWLVWEGDRLRDTAAVTNLRHIELLRRAEAAVQRAADAAEGGASEEFVLADLQSARGALEEITGRRASDEVLRHIFARFCIGK